MKSFSVTRRARLLGAALLLVCMVTGCRTYGGYGTEEKTLEQIHEANRVFGEQLARSQRDLLVIERTAAASPAFQGFVEQYRAVVAAHDAMLADHRSLAEEAERKKNDYRVLNRNLGAIVSEHQIIRDRYRRLFLDMDQAVSTPGVADTLQAFPTMRFPETMITDSRYYIAPVYYQRLMYANNLRRMAAGLPSGFTDSPELPEDSLSRCSQGLPGAAPDSAAGGAAGGTGAGGAANR